MHLGGLTLKDTQIDYDKPVDDFTLPDLGDFLTCLNRRNLQPLTCSAKRQKHATFTQQDRATWEGDNGATGMGLLDALRRRPSDLQSSMRGYVQHLGFGWCRQWLGQRRTVRIERYLSHPMKPRR